MAQDNEDVQRHIKTIATRKVNLENSLISACRDALRLEDEFKDKSYHLPKLNITERELKELEDWHELFNEVDDPDTFLKEESSKTFWHNATTSVQKMFAGLARSSSLYGEDFYIQLTWIYDAGLALCESAIASVPVLIRIKYGAILLESLVDRLRIIDNLLRSAGRIDDGFNQHINERQCLRSKLADYIQAADELEKSHAKSDYIPLLRSQEIEERIAENRQRKKNGPEEVEERIVEIRQRNKNGPEKKNTVSSLVQPRAQGKMAQVTQKLAALLPEDFDYTLVALIPGFLLWAAYFIGPAWQVSKIEPGKKDDADYCWLFQSNVMQWLNVAIIVCSLFKSPHGPLQSWFWQWIWVVASIGFPVASLPVYLYVSTPLAMTLAFFGAAAQAFVTLLGMVSAGKVKTE